MSGQRITDPLDMETKINTDRTKDNSKKKAEYVLYELERLKQYGIEFIIKSNYTDRHDIYQAHTIKKGKSCKKEFSFIGTEITLSDLHGFLGNLCSMFQDKYIFEAAIVTNEKKFTWGLTEKK